MLRSQDLIYLAESKVEEIVKRRMKKMKKQAGAELGQAQLKLG